MCGIVATYGKHGPLGVNPLVEVLASRLSHRGPDGFGADVLGHTAVAHARLAIVDVAGGKQPMRNEDGTVVLVGNGEIYNHRALRRDLVGNHEFRSESDSEVLLHLFEDFGTDSVRALDGMFAFFVSDGDRFVAARDPFGIKPLYMGEDERGDLWFASEIKALADRCSRPEAIPPGSFVTESRRIERWFEPTWADRAGSCREAEPLILISRLERAVVKRLMSDVELGVFLSGGLDSSLVAALARRHVSRLKTFAVGVEGAPDLAAARHVADVLGADHREYRYSIADVRRHLTDVVYHLESYDPALVRSAVPCFLVSSLASEEVKVVLTGEGADELFAGYSYMQHLTEASALHSECSRLVHGLHSMNLQRVDRMTMAHGVEGRVPFLDVGFVDWAMSLAPELKLREPGGMEKGLLRAAAEVVLPPEIARRPKLEFADGSSSTSMLSGYAADRISDRDMAQASARFPNDTPADKEELLYRLIFDDLFPGEGTRRTVARWRGPGAVVADRERAMT